MPYQCIDIDDFECSLISCINNDKGFCTADEDVDSLLADLKNCSYYFFVKNKEFITKTEDESDEIIAFYKNEGIRYQIINDQSDRLVLKTLNDKSGLFRVNKKDEEEFYFFSSIEGGVDYVHKSVKEADLFEGIGYKPYGGLLNRIMGGDIFLLMEEGEIEKAKIYLSNICFEGNSGELCILAPPLDLSYKDDPGDCWITFENDIIHIGYTMYEFSRHWAVAVACGIRNIFKIKRGAFESLEEENEEDLKHFMKMRPCQGAIRLIQDAQKRDPKFKSNLFDKPEGDLAVYKKLQEIYEDKIKVLFKRGKDVK